MRPDAKIKNFASEMFLEKGYLNKMVGWWLLKYPSLTHVVQHFKIKHDDLGGESIFGFVLLIDFSNQDQIWCKNSRLCFGEVLREGLFKQDGYLMIALFPFVWYMPAKISNSSNRIHIMMTFFVSLNLVIKKQLSYF